MRKQDDNVNHTGMTPEEGVLDLLHRVMHQYRALQYRVLRDGPYDITHMEGKVLAYFGHHAGATQSDLAQHSGRDKAQLARLIKSLRERGLLAGAAGESDRRSVSLSLTATGRTVLRTLQQESRRLDARATAGMSLAQQRALLALLQRVQANLEEPP